MVKYVCVKCGKIWYTANTSSDQKCDDCGGELKEFELYESDTIYKKCSSKI